MCKELEHDESRNCWLAKLVNTRYSREKLLIKAEIEIFSLPFNKSFLTSFVFLLSSCYGFFIAKSFMAQRRVEMHTSQFSHHARDIET